MDINSFNLFDIIYNDLLFTKSNDLSFDSLYLVFLFHNGFQSIFLYRLSNFLYTNGFIFLGLLFWRMNIFFTGADIHPKSNISYPIMIDHGIGVVIGETAIISQKCIIFQGVTLGGILGKSKGIRRHPLLEENVYVGAGAKILGPLSIKKNTKVGANCVLLKDTINECTAVGIPGKIINNDLSKNKKFEGII